MPSISGVVLTKDSERTIETCLKALKPAVDHIIVVDTGSTDNTVQIAKDCGARVYHFEWRDDFSAARNFGDSLATSDWVIHVDSDEILREEDTAKIRQICSKYRKTADPVAINILQINLTTSGVDIIPATRMYKRGTLIWKGIIHEQLTKYRVKNCYLTPSDIGVIHDGYNQNSIDYYDKVVSRNIRLLTSGLELEPENASYHLHLGRDYQLIGKTDLAIVHLTRAAELFERDNLPVGLEESLKWLEITRKA